MGSIPCSFSASGPSLPSLYTLRAYAPRQHALEECRSEQPQKAPQQPMKSSARWGPPKVIQAGLREGSFHQDPGICRKLKFSNFWGIMSSLFWQLEKGSLVSLSVPSIQREKKQTGTGRKCVWGGTKPMPFPYIAMQMLDQRAAHFTGSEAGLSSVHLQALLLTSCLTPER